jgi:hypothetical protein
MGGGREKLEGSEIDWKGEDGRFRKRLEGRSWKVKKEIGRKKLQGLGREWKGKVARFRKGMELEKLEDLEREWNWRSWKV